MSLNAKSILAPEQISYSAAVDPGANGIASLISLNESAHLSGFPSWTLDTVHALSKDALHNNHLVIEGMLDIFEFDRDWRSFEELVDHLEKRDPQWLIDRILQGCVRGRYGAYETDSSLEVPTPKQLLDDEALYLTHMERLHQKKEKPDLDFHSEIYSLVTKPKKLQKLVVSHLRMMWQEHLESEWQRVRPQVRAAASAFKNLDLSNLSPKDAIREVLGRDLMKSYSEEKFAGSEQMIFVPSAHIGPYALVLSTGKIAKLIFGAQHAERFQGETNALSRSEILVRLNALSDDTRLQIIELFLESEELTSQEVITILDLSQSSASRHLIQLCASGFLTEQRRANCKSYSLNRDRIDDTLSLVKEFLQAS